MELCTGGSLFNLLDDPENSYGLDEDEFLLGKGSPIFFFNGSDIKGWGW